MEKILAIDIANWFTYIGRGDSKSSFSLTDYVVIPTRDKKNYSDKIRDLYIGSAKNADLIELNEMNHIATRDLTRFIKAT